MEQSPKIVWFRLPNSHSYRSRPSPLLPHSLLFCTRESQLKEDSIKKFPIVSLDSREANCHIRVPSHSLFPPLRFVVASFENDEGLPHCDLHYPLSLFVRCLLCTGDHSKSLSLLSLYKGEKGEIFGAICSNLSDSQCCCLLMFRLSVVYVSRRAQSSMRPPLCWQLAAVLVISSLALASTHCNESALLSAGNAYHFTNCSNVSFTSIPSNNTALVVEDSTIVALSINTFQLSLTNVTLRFIRCTILSDLSLSSGASTGMVINGLTVELIACSVTFNTTALNSANLPAAFLFLSQPQGVDNLWIRMANSTYSLITIKLPRSDRGDFGFLNFFQNTRVSQLHNISVVIEDSRIDLLCTALDESDGIAIHSDARPSLVSFSVFRMDGASFTSSMSDVQLSFRNITGRMEGSMAIMLVLTEETIVNTLSIHVSNVTFQMASYGPFSNRSVQRSGRFIEFNDVPCNGCTIDIVNSQSHDWCSVIGAALADPQCLLTCPC